jgi:hypothetical protein
MEYPLPPALDSSQDIYEIGLMAAASPEFADALIRALLAAAEPDAAPKQALEPRIAA